MQKLNEKTIEILTKMIKEQMDQLFEEKETLQEADPVIEPQAGQQPVKKVAPTKRPVQQKAPAAPVKKTVARQQVKQAQVQAPKPPKSPEQQKLDAQRSRPPKPKVNSDVITRVQYQIFATKMAMSRLDTNILAQKFTESLHDFDLNISKNDKDPQKINAYMLPVIGNIEALKNASEALQIEFNKLKALLDKALNAQ